MASKSRLLGLLIALAIAGSAECASDPFYTAAVLEHVRLGNWTDPANETIPKNLASYQRAAEVAKIYGSEIIVFPEYGLFAPNERPALKAFLENIPDPKSTYVNPCNERDVYIDRPILYTLSCMAQNNSIYIVANMGDMQNCTGDPDCPADGVFHYNTNVVLDKNGTLVVKYYKEHLFFEFGMDVVKRQQDPVFRTDFGRFATFTSFDIVFKKMSEVVDRVDAILFSSFWLDIAPQFKSVQYWESWALGNNATLLVSNVHLPGYFTTGSGIFRGKTGAMVYSFNPDGTSKLVVARVPKAGVPQTNTVTPDARIFAISGGEHWPLKNDGRKVQMECSRQLLNDTQLIHEEYRCIDEENISNYTLVKLTKHSDHIEACHNGMCCSLDYTTNKLSENFYLGVYNGTHNAFNRYTWCEEKCILVRCDPVDGKECATFPRLSKTRFHLIHMTANFTAARVYPSLLSSGVRLVSLREWSHGLNTKSEYEGRLNFKSQIGRKIILAGFEGRCFDRDPPYIR